MRCLNVCRRLCEAWLCRISARFMLCGCNVLSSNSQLCPQSDQTGHLALLHVRQTRMGIPFVRFDKPAAEVHIFALLDDSPKKDRARQAGVELVPTH